MYINLKTKELSNPHCNKREIIDIAKGIGITLVVIGHSGSVFTNFIYLFHMALFFMISGYCYNEKHSENIVKIKEYFLSRLKRLYIPFIVFNFGLLFWDILVSPHISSCLSLGIDFTHIVQANYIIKSLIKILLFGHYECVWGNFAESLWFLRVLFSISILFCIILNLLNKIKDISLKNFSFATTAVLMLLIGELLKAHKLIIPGNYCSVFTFYFFFALGYVLKIISQRGLNYQKEKLISIISLILLITLSVFNEYVEASVNNWSSMFTLITSSVAGWIITKYISKKIEYSNNIVTKALKKCLVYSGKHTMSVLLFHEICFKFVIIIQIFTLNIPISSVLCHPTLNSKGVWWLVYCIFGVVIPLCLSYLVDMCITKYRIIRRERL